MDSSSSSSPPPRRRLDNDLEEGELVPTAYQQSSNTTGGYQQSDDDGGLLHRSRPPHGHCRRRLTLEEILALGRGPTPSCESSDGTISDDDRGANPSPASVFSKAEPNKRVAALDEGWAATGRRAWTGGKLLFSAALPLDAAQSSHSNVSGDSSSAHADAIHQPPPPNADQAPQLVHHQPAAAAAAPAPPPPAAQQQLPGPVAAPRRPQREYTCKFCGKAYTSHQALGGHVAKHKSMQREAEAAADAAAAAGMAMPPQDGRAFLAALRRARRAEAASHHQCRKCHKVFATGVALGGHMRAHYTGPPIVPARRKNRNSKGGLAPLALEDVVAVAAPPPTGLSLALSSIKKEEAPPSTAPAGAGRVVRLFGIDISPKVQAPLEQPCSGISPESAGVCWRTLRAPAVNSRLPLC